jgi:hypothetical protein
VLVIIGIILVCAIEGYVRGCTRIDGNAHNVSGYATAAAVIGDTDIPMNSRADVVVVELWCRILAFLRHKKK